MATKTVRVVIEREIEIMIPDGFLTDENLKNFSSYMFKIDSIDGLFEYAATCVFENEDVYIKGLGKAKWRDTCSVIKPDDILYDQVYEDIEATIVD